MTYTNFNISRVRLWCLSLLFVMLGAHAFAGDKDFPEKPNPPRLVNDYAGILSSQEEERLEHKLEDFARTTSTRITIVAIPDLGSYDVSDYAIKLFNKWQIGAEGKNNGVLLLVAINNHRSMISVGKGLEGALTDAQSARILRNELKPAFKAHNYAEGLEKATDAIIAATKGEYKADETDGIGGGRITGKAIIVLLIFIFIIIKIIGRGGRGGGGGYIGGRGIGNFATGMLLGNLLGGGRGGWGGGGGGDWGGGGFGGFGGGSTGGGGASGDW